ncbi:MAG TPA: T9SS type A sorting domain-containing protein, partial [Bacteroidota bacterium]|nr:T9SS type A sorting domain-containing protein [Bacteroidota bacterium]
AVEKKYSRNLGIGDGIELVKLTNVLTSVASQSKPESFSLAQNYPNPFNPKTVISGQWSVTSDVRLVVYDVLGKEVAVLANGRYPAGKYAFTFDGTNLSSGVYFCRLTAQSYSAVRKMALVK